jgi:hypothetical protein
MVAMMVMMRPQLEIGGCGRLNEGAAQDYR